MGKCINVKGINKQEYGQIIENNNNLMKNSETENKLFKEVVYILAKEFIKNKKTDNADIIAEWIKAYELIYKRK